MALPILSRMALSGDDRVRSTMISMYVLYVYQTPFCSASDRSSFTTFYVVCSLLRVCCIAFRRFISIPLWDNDASLTVSLLGLCSSRKTFKLGVKLTKDDPRARAQTGHDQRGHHCLAPLPSRHRNSINICHYFQP